MTKLITPEMVEKAMKEFRQLYLEFGHSDETAVRAALSAVLPDIIEEIAQIAHRGIDNHWNRIEVVDAIRQLGKE